MQKLLAICVVCAVLVLPEISSAQSAYEELQSSIRAEVIDVLDERRERIPGTDATSTVQTLQARIKGGDRANDVVTFENDRIPLSIGDRVFLDHIRSINGDEFYQLRDVDRRGPLIVLGLFFLVLLVWFARAQGARAVLSLALSIGAILFVLVPALLAGYDPALTALFVSIIILALVLFGTHGFRSIPLIAFFGTTAAVIITSTIAWVSVRALRFTGFGADAAVYLNFATDGKLDFTGLLLGSIIIGMLGVLDDVSITQASVVGELRRANSGLSGRELYSRGLRVGRDHVGSLVNTLALAYVGAALPLVLLFATSEAAVGISLNQEVVAAEIARIVIGSIGIILAVPFTTVAAAWWFDRSGAVPEDLHVHGQKH